MKRTVGTNVITFPIRARPVFKKYKLIMSQGNGVEVLGGLAEI